MTRGAALVGCLSLGGCDPTGDLTIDASRLAEAYPDVVFVTDVVTRGESTGLLVLDLAVELEVTVPALLQAGEDYGFVAFADVDEDRTCTAVGDPQWSLIYAAGFNEDFVWQPVLGEFEEASACTWFGDYEIPASP